MTENFIYEEFLKFKNVPRETFLKLEVYIDLLKKWQTKINLISNSTVPDIWKRHVLDSVQLINYLSKSDHVVDIGSGAGFPGVVLAILGIENMTLIDSDLRKVTFLKEVARITETKINILSGRVENVVLGKIDVITARGFAPLNELLGMVSKHIDSNTKLLLLKGKNTLEEIELAQKNWAFNYKNHPSLTSQDGVVTLIQNIKQSKKGHNNE